jgi:hypothetical protein
MRCELFWGVLSSINVVGDALSRRREERKDVNRRVLFNPLDDTSADSIPYALITIPNPIISALAGIGNYGCRQPAQEAIKVH